MNNLEELAQKAKEIKLQIKALDNDLDDLETEIIKQMGTLRRYHGDGVLISTLEDTNISKIDLEGLKKEMSKYLNNEVIEEIIANSQRLFNRQGGIRIILK